MGFGALRRAAATQAGAQMSVIEGQRRGFHNVGNFMSLSQSATSFRPVFGAPLTCRVRVDVSMGSQMAVALKKIALTAASVAALVAGLGLASASASDLPTHKAPPPAPTAAAPSWTGFYIGVEGGADWANSGWTTTGLGTDTAPDGSAGSHFDQAGGRVGAYAGYNWQISPLFVTGVEADIAGDFFSSKTKSGIPGTLSYVTTPYADSVSAHDGFADGSVRARLGYLVTPTTLVYGTGGIAFANPKYSVNCPAGGDTSWCTDAESGSQSPTRVGWTLGAGVETILWTNWVARLEYRYSGFGNKNVTFFPNGAAGFDAITARTSLDTNVVSLGLAYKF